MYVGMDASYSPQSLRARAPGVSPSAELCALCSRRGKRWLRLRKGVDVCDDVVDRLVIRERRGHEVHLRSIQVSRMRAADAFPEVLQLCRQVPIAHALKPGCVGGRYPAPVRTMAGSAGSK